MSFNDSCSLEKRHGREMGAKVLATGLSQPVFDGALGAAGPVQADSQAREVLAVWPEGGGSLAGPGGFIAI
jgi:hypothetical protein